MESIRVSEALEGKPAVAEHHDLRLDHVVCSGQTAESYDLPGAGWAHPGPGQEPSRHA